MATDGKFEVELLPGHTPLHEGEPVFCFRGQDALLPVILCNYLASCFGKGCPQSHIDAVDAQLTKVIEWQAANLNLVKLPD